MFSLRIRIRPKLCSLTNFAQKATCAGKLQSQIQPAKFTLPAQSLSTAAAAAAVSPSHSKLWEHVRKYGNTEQTQETTLKAHCWNCKKETIHGNQMICNECGHLQDVDAEINYFDLLNLPRKYELELQALTQRFRQLQAIVHPDKYSNKSEREQTNSAEWSSLINKAYKTLATPIERGQYLLKLNGQSLPEDNSALDKEFLMEMMERNEEVEDATNANELKQLDERINEDLKAAAKQLKNAFDGSNDLKSARAILIKMKYLISVQQSIKTKLQSLMGMGH